MDIATSFRRMAPDFHGLLGELSPGTLHAAAFSFATSAAVAEWLRRAGPVTGWCVLWGLDSDVWISAEPSLLEPEGCWLGDGEFFAPGARDGEAVSLRVRPLAGEWRGAAYAAKPGALAPLGAPRMQRTITGVWQPRRYLVDPRFDLGPPHPEAQADYRIWWAEDAALGFGPVADVFHGFTLGPQEINEAEDG